MRRRAAIEHVIGHLKAEHRMERNYLKGREGDRINAVLAAAGYNFALLLRWFKALLRALITALPRAPFTHQTARKSVSEDSSQTTDLTSSHPTNVATSSPVPDMNPSDRKML